MKREPALQPLSHDHYEGLQFAARVKRALASSEDTTHLSREAAAFWEEHLVPHFGLEELWILPLLRTASGPMAERMRREHAEIEALVSSLAMEPERATASLAALADALIAHIRFEEREAFPAVETAADPDTLAELQTALNGTRTGHPEREYQGPKRKDNPD